MKSQTTRMLLTISLCLGLLAVLRWLPAGAQGLPESKNVKEAASGNLPVPITSVCGIVTEFQAATANSTGLLVIGGVRFMLATGSSVGGFAVGANVCATFCLDENGLVTNVIGGVSNNAGVKTTVCGIVTEWRPWESLAIGGAKFRIDYNWINGQSLIAPGINICLSPIYNENNKLTIGSSVIAAPGTLPIRVPALVHGTKYGPNWTDGDEAVFQLPSPFILNVQTPIPTGVELKPGASNYWTPYSGFNAKDVVSFCSSTPNSTVRALACSESLWDLFFKLTTSGATDGDMITLALQNPDGSNVQVLAMFTIQNGSAVVTQIHPDIKMTSISDGLGNLKVGSVVSLRNMGQGLMSGTIIIAFSMNSARLDGCFQYYTEIKRASGVGTTCIDHIAAVVKRKVQYNDRESDASDIETGAQGWYPTGLPCAVSCDACLPPPPVQPLPGSLSGYVYCDTSNDGIRQGNEAGIANVNITLTGVDISGAVNRTVATNDAGFYIFPNLMPGVYKITETQQPAGTTDGQDLIGTLGGTTTNDMFSNIPLPSLGKGENYNFGEICTTATPTPTPSPTPTPATPKCDTVCWRSTAWLIQNSRYWPGGTVLVAGLNANNPISIQSNVATLRNVLNGGNAPSQKLNREFVAAQLSLSLAGGSGSPVVFNVFWSPLRCSLADFAPVTLSNGVVLTPDSLLDTLNTQTVLAIRENRSQDFDELASIWAQLNGRCY